MPCQHQAPNLALNQTSPARGLFLSGIDAGPPVSFDALGAFERPPCGAACGSFGSTWA